MRKALKLKRPVLVLLILSLFIGIDIVRHGISTILAAKEDVQSIERSLFFDSSNAEANFYLARLYQFLMLGDEKSIEVFYLRSIELNPLLSSSWLGLTELYIENGEIQKANMTLARTLELIPLSIGFLWESSLLAFRLGNYSAAMDKLRIVAKADASKRERVFDICWELIGDPELILRNVVSDEILPSYLKYLIKKDKLDETYVVWDSIKQKEIASDQLNLRYIDFLIHKRDIKRAKNIWNDLFPDYKNNSIVWNGSFENEPSGRGFDWRIRSVDGVNIDFDETKKTKGRQSLRLKFPGEKNVDFSHVEQIIPVDPNSSYILTSNISTEDITTRNGIGWEVYCKGMRESSETITGTVDWITTNLTFTTPSDCVSINLRLRRYKSNKLDKYISGTAWVDNVNIFKLDRKTDV